MAKFYKAKTVAKVGANYVATGGVVAGSFLLGNPIAMAISAALGGGLLAAVTGVMKRSYGKDFVKHPEVHPDSPNLGKTVKELYEASGLKAPEGYPVYSFNRIEKPTTKKKKSRSIFSRITKPMDPGILNASALRLGKTTVISISDPLLKLLDDKEEKAVLAHEFAHAAARHTGVALPTIFANMTATINNAITQTFAVLALGTVPFLATAAADVIGEGLFKLVTRTGKLISKKDDDMTLTDLAKKKKFKKWSKLAGTAAFMGALAYFSPACLGIVAAVKGLSVAGTLLSKSLSRTNEYQADAGAVALGGDPLALMTALRKISLVNKTCLNEALEIEKNASGGGTLPKSGILTRAWNRLNASHPSNDNRIKRLSTIARKQGIAEEQITDAAKGELIVPKMSLPNAVLQRMV